jgi:hypothetical protein
LWWCGVLIASVGTAWLSLRSLQLGATVVLLVLGVGLHRVNRAAGLTVVWVVWLLAPWLRRVLALESPISGSDPLALAPFLLTGCIVLAEIHAAKLSRFATGTLIVVAVGYLIGVPAGMGEPASVAYALLAYLVAAGCMVIGYREPDRLEGLTLRTVLVYALPWLALYSVLQYVGPLPSWDDAWVASVSTTLNSIGAPDGEHIRVFGTLNSPGTFANVLGIGAVCLFASRRLGPLKVLALAAVLAGLALTFVRGAWLSMIAAAAIIVFASRGRASWRVVVVGGLIAVALVGLASRGGTGATIVGRADTLGSLGTDTSAQARVATPLELVPEAVTSVVGHGLGSAGEASRLGGPSDLRNTDNGYLSLLYQTGPVGFLLVIGAALAAMLRAIGNLRRRGNDAIDVLVAGLIGYFVVGLFGGDLLYGITGMAFWYLLGIGIRRSEPA